jgi:hypothetical protein
MGRAKATADGFTAVFGNVRGISEAAQAERARHPRAVRTDFASGEISICYYFDNDPNLGLHNEDGPALIIIQANGNRTEEWLHKGLLHREDGPATIETIVTDKGVQHTNCFYYQHDLLHREDGPARDYINHAGERVREWYSRGVRTR